MRRECGAIKISFLVLRMENVRRRKKEKFVPEK